MGSKAATDEARIARALRDLGAIAYELANHVEDAGDRWLKVLVSRLGYERSVVLAATLEQALDNEGRLLLLRAAGALVDEVAEDREQRAATRKRRKAAEVG